MHFNLYIYIYIYTHTYIHTIYIYVYIYIYILHTGIKHGRKKKPNLASTQANNLIDELPERREKSKAQVHFR